MVGIIEFGFVFQKLRSSPTRRVKERGFSFCPLGPDDAVARVNQYLTASGWIPLSQRCPHQPIRMISSGHEPASDCDRVRELPALGPVSGRDWPLLNKNFGTFTLNASINDVTEVCWGVSTVTVGER